MFCWTKVYFKTDVIDQLYPFFMILIIKFDNEDSHIILRMIEHYGLIININCQSFYIFVSFICIFVKFICTLVRFTCKFVRFIYTFFYTLFSFKCA